MNEKSSFALIIPCYNEEKAIPSFRNELSAFVSYWNANQPMTELTIIIVDNNSSDNSARLLNTIKSDQPTLKVMGCKQQGYGAALKAGFSSVNCEWYGFADLDNTYPLQRLSDMFTLAKAKDLQIVFANRLRLDTEMPLVRKIGNLFFSSIANIIFAESVHDTCTGMRVFRHEIKSKVTKLNSNNLDFSIEFTAVALKEKWRKAEMNIIYRERLGQSKLSVVRDGICFLIALVKVRISS